MKIWNFICYGLGLLTWKNISEIYNRKKDDDYAERSKLSERNRSYYQLCNQWIDNLHNGKNMSVFFKEHGWRKIAIYGCGSLAELMYAELKENSENIKAEDCLFLDGNMSGERALGKHTIFCHTLETAPLNGIDVVIVTPVHAFEEIRQDLLKKKQDINVIGIDTVVYSM